MSINTTTTTTSTTTTTTMFAALAAAEREHKITIDVEPLQIILPYEEEFFFKKHDRMIYEEKFKIKPIGEFANFPEITLSIKEFYDHLRSQQLNPREDIGGSIVRQWLSDFPYGDIDTSFVFKSGTCLEVESIIIRFLVNKFSESVCKELEKDNLKCLTAILQIIENHDTDDEIDKKYLISASAHFIKAAPKTWTELRSAFEQANDPGKFKVVYDLIKDQKWQERLVKDNCCIYSDRPFSKENSMMERRNQNHGNHIKRAPIRRCQAEKEEYRRQCIAKYKNSRWIDFKIGKELEFRGIDEDYAAYNRSTCHLDGARIVRRDGRFFLSIWVGSRAVTEDKEFEFAKRCIKNRRMIVQNPRELKLQHVFERMGVEAPKGGDILCNDWEYVFEQLESDLKEQYYSNRRIHCSDMDGIKLSYLNFLLLLQKAPLQKQKTLYEGFINAFISDEKELKEQDLKDEGLSQIFQLLSKIRKSSDPAKETAIFFSLLHGSLLLEHLANNNRIICKAFSDYNKEYPSPHFAIKNITSRYLMIPRISPERLMFDFLQNLETADKMGIEIKKFVVNLIGDSKCDTNNKDQITTLLLNWILQDPTCKYLPNEEEATTKNEPELIPAILRYLKKLSPKIYSSHPSWHYFESLIISKNEHPHHHELSSMLQFKCESRQVDTHIDSILHIIREKEDALKKEPNLKKLWLTSLFKAVVKVREQSPNDLLKMLKVLSAFKKLLGKDFLDNKMAFLFVNLIEEQDIFRKEKNGLAERIKKESELSLKELHERADAMILSMTKEMMASRNSTEWPDLALSCLNHIGNAFLGALPKEIAEISFMDLIQEITKKNLYSVEPEKIKRLRNIFNKFEKFQQKEILERFQDLNWLFTQEISKDAKQLRILAQNLKLFLHGNSLKAPVLKNLYSFLWSMIKSNHKQAHFLFQQLQELFNESDSNALVQEFSRHELSRAAKGTGPLLELLNANQEDFPAERARQLVEESLKSGDYTYSIVVKALNVVKRSEKSGFASHCLTLYLKSLWKTDNEKLLLQLYKIVEEKERSEFCLMWCNCALQKNNSILLPLSIATEHIQSQKNLSDKIALLKKISDNYQRKNDILSLTSLIKTFVKAIGWKPLSEIPNEYNSFLAFIVTSFQENLIPKEIQELLADDIVVPAFYDQHVQKFCEICSSYPSLLTD